MNTPAKKTLFLGDSYTVGTNLGTGHKRDAFPYQLKDKLDALVVKTAEPKLYAVDGDTTKHLLGALNAMEPLSNPGHPQHALTKEPYDLVTLSIGINDMFRGYTLADYKQHFGELLARAVWFAADRPEKVMVIGMPALDASPSISDGSGLDFRAGKYEQVRLNSAADPSYNTQQGMANEIDRFNMAAKAITEAAGAQFIDITDLTRNAGTPDPALFTKDGIHYSGAMYAHWVARFLPIAQRILANA